MTSRPRGRIEVWLNGKRRIGVLDVKANSDAAKEQTAPIQVPALAGPHDVTLKIVGGKNIGRLSTFEFR